MALSNFLATAKMLAPFRAVLANPRRFDRATYQRSRPTNAGSSTAPERDRGASSSVWSSAATTLPALVPDTIEPAIERFRAVPAKLDDFPFSLLYSAVLAWGPARIAPVASRVAPLIAPAIAAKRAAPSKSIAELAVGNLANLLACCGYPDETGPVADWLYQIETSKDEETSYRHWDRSFAALALDVRKLYRTLGGESPGKPLELEPSRGFGGNLQGLLRHFGAAVEHGAGFAAIEPAWRDLVANLERHDQSGQISPATTFWIARVVHHRIGGAPLGDVA